MSLYRILKSEALGAIAIVLGVVLITYGPGLTLTGFYLDDWYILWAGHAIGPQMIADLHLWDRPLMGIIFAFYYRFFGDNPLSWQLFVLFLTGVSGLAVLRLGRRIWPEKVLETTVIALLFVLYPGFLQHPNAMTYSNHISSHVFAILSISFTIEAFTSTQKWKVILFHSLALIFTSIHVFYIEYMIGVESLRYLLSWIVLSRTSLHIQERLSFFVKKMAVYLFPPATMIFWRLFFFESGRRAMNVGEILSGYTNSPVRVLISLVIEGGRDFIETTIFAWFINVYTFLAEASYREVAISLGLAVLALILFAIYAFPHMRKEGGEDSKWGKTLLVIGIGSALFTILPVVAVGRSVELGSSFNSFNRYTIHAALSVSFIVIGASEMLLTKTGRILLFSCLIALAVIPHYHSTLKYIKSWDYQRELWWQLSWRAPDIQDDTLLVISLPRGFRFLEGYEIWGAANLVYRPNTQLVTIDGQILNSETMGWFEREISDQPTFRGILPLDRDYGQALFITIPDELSCVHVLGGRIDDPLEDPLVLQTVLHSHLDRIILDSEPVSPPQSTFGLEPPHTWCYYYQKISLAGQGGDWQLAAILAEEAMAQDYKPLNRAEWMPVYEAFANAGRLEEARNIAKILKDDRNLRSHICSQLTISPEDNHYNDEFIYSTLCGN